MAIRISSALFMTLALVAARGQKAETRKLDPNRIHAAEQAENERAYDVEFG